MRAINRIYVHGILPLLESERHSGLGRRWGEFENSEKLSLEENSEHQWKKLKQLLQHAYKTTAFYRKRFDDCGMKPEDIKTPADFKKLPVLTRDDIRHHLDEMCSSAFASSQLRPSATGGTTDTPVPFRADFESVRTKVAAQLRLNSWASYFPGDKAFMLWGARVDFAQNPSWRWRLYDRRLMRRVWAPTSMFNEEVLGSYLRKLNEFRPDVIVAYPTPLAIFCDYLLNCGSSYHRPKSAICTAEGVLDSQREVIEKALGCRVFEHYGSREFGMIAAECSEHSGLHVNPLLSFLEFVPVHGGEQDGLSELVITDLTNYGMPLIRYKGNDCVLPGPEQPCPCGIGYPRIAKIMGRTTEIFRLPGGEVVPGVALTNRIIQVCPGIKKIQVIQEKLDEFLLRYVPGESFSVDDLKPLRSKLDAFFGARVQWQFESVSDIPREKSGKTRMCISRVPVDQPRNAASTTVSR